MFKVDIINYKIKSSTVVFLFVPLMSNKNTTIENISIFKDLNIYQLKLTKENPQFNELFKI